MSRTASSVFVRGISKALGDRTTTPSDSSEFVTAVVASSRFLIEAVAFDVLIDDATLASV